MNYRRNNAKDYYKVALPGDDSFTVDPLAAIWKTYGAHTNGCWVQWTHQ
jgi:hypothetical protein